jgi:hypothetical protein
MRITSGGDIQVQGGDIFLNSGTNYNDKGVVYLSNERTAIISDIVNATANGDTSLDFQTRKGGTRASAMYIDEFRNVGIGTTSPNFKLNVHRSDSTNTTIGITNSSTGDARLYFDASNGDGAGSDYMQMGQQNDLSGFIQMEQSAGSFNIKTGPGGSDRLTVLQGGNVGIGVTSPNNGKLEVQQTATTAALWVQTGGTTDSYTIADFRTGANASALAIKGNGRVGVGESSPAEKLEVNGNIKAADLEGKFFSNVYTATTQSQVDTISYTGPGMWEYNIRLNPNPGGSSGYADFYYGRVGIGGGYNGAVGYHLWSQQDQIAPRTLYPSGGSNKSLTWVMVKSDGSEVTNVAYGVNVTLRVKGFGGNSYNQDIRIYLRRLA